MRNHQMGLAQHGRPIGQFVVIGIRVIEEAAVFHDQSAGIHARAVAAVPAFRFAADGFFDAVEGAADAFALNVFGHVLVVFPAPAVGADVVAAFSDAGAGFGVALQGQAATFAGAAAFGQAGFAEVVAIGDRRLAAFFVVDDEVQRQRGAGLPLGVGRVG